MLLFRFAAATAAVTVIFFTGVLHDIPMNQKLARAADGTQKDGLARIQKPVDQQIIHIQPA